MNSPLIIKINTSICLDLGDLLILEHPAFSHSKGAVLIALATLDSTYCTGYTKQYLLHWLH